MANIKRSYVRSLGKSTDDVTGSCFELVTTSGDRVLIDCGMKQSSDDLKDYRDNIEIIKNLKIKRLDAIVLSHSHIDHSGNIPAAFANGFTGIVYMPKNSKDIVKLLWLDSAKIMQQSQQLLKKKGNVSGKPTYTAEDVEVAYNHIVECEFNQVIEISENLSFQYIHSNHIISSSQIIFYVKDNGITKTVGYCCDLGSPNIQGTYLDPFEPINRVNLLIGECTYGMQLKTNNKKNRNKDKEKIKTLIEQVNETGGRLIIPAFSLNRSQDILTVLYELFHDDEEFKMPIVFDGVLSMEVSKRFEDCINYNKELWNKVFSWGAVVKVSDWTDSLAYQNYTSPQIIVASGGMLKGRSTAYVKKWLSDPKTTICLVGYAGGEGSVGYMIQREKEFPVINIDGSKIQNKAHVISLNSFSSHASHAELLEYYSSIECEKIYLVHSQEDRKKEFKPLLEEEISKKNHTTKVVLPDSKTKMYL